MKIHKEGYVIIAVILIILNLILVSINYVYPIQTIVHYILYGLASIFFFFVVRFFRVPNRTITIDENAIYAPADGEIVVIEEVIENEYYHEQRKQISIFMSPLNVHVNFYPISGVVVYKKYHPGRFLVAWHPKSSTENERNTLVVASADSKKSILFRQIAGFVARRIVTPVEVNDNAVQGGEFGMIKFGSRVDVFLPIDANIQIKMGQKVTAKKTILATFNKA